MNNNFNSALENAFDEEFLWLNDFENPYAFHTFSSGFENEMRKIIPKAKYNYVSIGHKRIHRTLIAALVALLALAITGFTIAACYVTWHENNNPSQGTVDITFEQGVLHDKEKSDVVLPTLPEGYATYNKETLDSSVIITYMDDEKKKISYSRIDDLDNMSVSIDNENVDLNLVSINGYKGYTSKSDGISIIYWCDSWYFHTLQGTCDLETLVNMAESTIE